jgi:protein SCO1/2
MARPTIWLISLIVGLLVFGCRQQAAEPHLYGQQLDPPLPIADFELKTAQGESYQLSRAESDLVLIYFGYTSCPDLCLLTLWDIRQALADMSQASDQVQVLFITVDPERDTPAVLIDYLANFNPDFIGLRDDPEKVQAVMDLFGAMVEVESAQVPQHGYLVSHTAQLYLVDPRQGLLVTYPATFKADELRRDLAYLLATRS